MTKIDTSTEAVEALLKDVTPGPWERTPSNPRKVIPVAGLCLAHFSKGANEPHAEANTQFLLVASKLVQALLAERDKYKSKFEVVQKAQTYSYIGRDGKAVLARDLEDERDQLRDELDAAHAIIAAERGEVIKLREALKPFSDEASYWFCKNYSASDTPVSQVYGYTPIMTCGDLFNARAALNQKDTPNDN